MGTERPDVISLKSLGQRQERVNFCSLTLSTLTSPHILYPPSTCILTPSHSSPLPHPPHSYSLTPFPSILTCTPLSHPHTYTPSITRPPSHPHTYITTHPYTHSHPTKHTPPSTVDGIHNSTRYGGQEVTSRDRRIWYSNSIDKNSNYNPSTPAPAFTFLTSSLLTITPSHPQLPSPITPSLPPPHPHHHTQSSS